MLRLNCIKHYLSIVPFEKAITRLGIHTDRVVFNPTVPELYQIAFLN